jgi:hypothetical protein
VWSKYLTYTPYLVEGGLSRLIKESNQTDFNTGEDLLKQTRSKLIRIVINGGACYPKLHVTIVREEFQHVASRSDQEVRPVLSIMLLDEEEVDHRRQEVQRVPQFDCSVHRGRQFWPVA